MTATSTTLALVTRGVLTSRQLLMSAIVRLVAQSKLHVKARETRGRVPSTLVSCQAWTPCSLMQASTEFDLGLDRRVGAASRSTRPLGFEHLETEQFDRCDLT
jgi:hypothetical protein